MILSSSDRTADRPVGKNCSVWRRCSFSRSHKCRLGAVYGRDYVEVYVYPESVRKYAGRDGYYRNHRREDRLRSRLVSRFQNARVFFQRRRERPAATLGSPCGWSQSSKPYASEG